MPYRGDPIAEALDRIAERTGVPAMNRRMEERPVRPLRFLPGALLLLVMGGLALAIGGSPFGLAITSTGWSGTIIAQMFSPMRADRRSLDERERALMRLGHLWGLATAMALSVGACFWLGFASALREGGVNLWMPQGPQEWIAIGFALMALEANIAMLATSWVLPRPVPDED
jgi:Na+/proline symporter